MDKRAVPSGLESICPPTRHFRAGLSHTVPSTRAPAIPNCGIPHSPIPMRTSVIIAPGDIFDDTGQIETTMVRRHKWSLVSLAITIGTPAAIIIARAATTAYGVTNHNWIPPVGGFAVLASVAIGIFAAFRERGFAASIISIDLGLMRELLYLD